MFNALVAVTIRFRKLLLAVTVVGALASTLWGIGVFDRLASGGFDDPASESAQAAAHLDDELGRADADLIYTIDSPDRTVDDPAYAADVDSALALLPADAV